VLVREHAGCGARPAHHSPQCLRLERLMQQYPTRTSLAARRSRRHGSRPPPPSPVCEEPRRRRALRITFAEGRDRRPAAPLLNWVTSPCTRIIARTPTSRTTADVRWSAPSTEPSSS
jgi:hypothetical protein